MKISELRMWKECGEMLDNPPRMLDNQPFYYNKVGTNEISPKMYMYYSVIYYLEYRFGELIDGGLNFNLLTENTFLYYSTILACKRDVNSAAIAWQYSVNADLSSSEVLTATYMSTQTGVSWLSVHNTKQGYYQCYIDSTNRNTVGLYDTQKTTGQ